MKKFILGIILFMFIIGSCNEDTTLGNLDFKAEMRTFVIGISNYSKAIKSDFYVIPQNGLELVSDNGEESGNPHAVYIAAIDGNGQEDLFFGYSNDNQATSNTENTYLRSFLDISKDAGNTILTTDYCSTPSKMDDSYTQNNTNNYVSFAADHRELDNIPTYPTSIYNENNDSITNLSEIKNFLYLINPENFNTKTDFINAVTATNYDLIIMDLFFHDNEPFTNAEIQQLRIKANGGSRLMICYMSIGEAEDYRYYWNADWNSKEPDWLDKENPNWAGNFKVKYWNQDWKSIIYGNDNSYLKKIIDAGFDGVYLDIIDAFEYYE
ncbi:MAG: cysteinyl-tRNA synthetase [Saprospiraceae bacterium]|jgi:cysteinyl-tRNA synthetase|tara:strand:+ start:373 stop:1344 length:972 start_codon:yes stop_codon:yes gene_type:complete